LFADDTSLGYASQDDLWEITENEAT
jgi:hypothetical protein